MGGGGWGGCGEGEEGGGCGDRKGAGVVGGGGEGGCGGGGGFGWIGGEVGGAAEVSVVFSCKYIPLEVSRAYC